MVLQSAAGRPRFVFTLAILSLALATISLAGGRKSKLRTGTAERASATSPSSPQVTSSQRPTFNSPPIFSVAGNNVGQAGLYSMVHADFNGDGIPDLASVGFYCARPSQGTAAIFLGKGDGTFNKAIYTPAGQCPGVIHTAKLRGPNAANDLLVIDAAGSKLWLLLGNGDGTFAAPVQIDPGFGVNDVAAGDFNEDGKLDLAIGVQNNVAPLAIMLGNGDGTFQSATTFNVAPAAFSLVVGKFSVTGHDDVLLFFEDGIYLTHGLGDGTFLPGNLVWQEPNTLFSVNPPGSITNGITAVTVGDFNKDGNLDLAVDSGATRVDILLGSGTGVFVPAPIPTYLFNENQTGFGGGDIAAADLRGTGNLDLVISTGYGATGVILNGNGDGTFQTPVIYPLPEFDDATLALIDTNHDGKIDIVFGTEGGNFAQDGNFLTVMLNKNGGFDPPPSQFIVTSPADQALAENPIGIALGDLNGDGKLDLVVTLWGGTFGPIIDGKIPNPPHVNPNTGQITSQGSFAVMLGNGDGSFAEPHYYLVGARPIAPKIVDLTGDGKKDIVVANAITNTLSVLKGNGDGTFQTAIDLPSGAAPNTVAIADVNGDGKPDIIGTNNGDQTAGVYINNSTPGNLNFAAQVTYRVGLYPSGVGVGDFNGDGKIDLVVLNNGDVYNYSSPTTITVLLNNGDGTFAVQSPQTVWNFNGGDSITIADFSGTGRLDLAVVNFSSNQLRILRGNGNGTFTPGENYWIGEGAEDVKAIDLNGDGVLDLVTCNLNDDTITLLSGKGDGTFVPAEDRSSDNPVAYGFPAFGYPTFFDLADLNGDAKPDLVTGNIFNRTVTVLKNTTLLPVRLLNVLSRKVHGALGALDVDLTSGTQIECRSGGSSGNYTLVFRFATPLKSVDSVSVASGTGTVQSSGIGSDTREYVVNLTGVTNAQRLSVSLSNVTDMSGNFSAAISGSLPVLVGDTTGDRFVDSADIAQTKSQSGQPVTRSNIREDLNNDGFIDSADIALVKSKSGTALP
jgi:hypothetical protein